MDKVYIVSCWHSIEIHDPYGNHHDIYGVYSTEEKAQKVADALNKLAPECNLTKDSEGNPVIGPNGVPEPEDTFVLWIVVPMELDK